MARKTSNRKEQRQPPEIEGFEDVFRTGLSPDQVEFLFAYIQHGSIISAARESGLDRSRHYEWMRTRLYAESFTAARRHILGALETEAERRAMDGVIEPVFGKGGLLGKRRRYSDTLLVKLLEANGPEKYGRDTGKDAGSGLVCQTIFYDPQKGRPPDKGDLPQSEGPTVRVWLPDNGREPHSKKDGLTVVLPIKRPRPEMEESAHESDEDLRSDSERPVDPTRFSDPSDR